MSEKQLWRWLSSGPLPGHGFYSRIESPDTSPGIPDVYYRVAKEGGWIELKFDRRPKSDKPFSREEDGLHLSQRIWINKAIEMFDRVFVVAAMSDNKILWFDMRIVSTYSFNELTRAQLMEKASLILTKPIRRKDIPSSENTIELLLIS